MSGGLRFAGLALALCACAPERDPDSLPAECRPRPDSPSPPQTDDDVGVREPYPVWSLWLTPQPNPDCAGETEGRTTMTLRWIEDAGVEELRAPAQIRTRYTAARGRCRMSARIEISAALPPGRAEVLLCDAVLVHRDWASLDELDIDLAGFGASAGGAPVSFPVRRPLNVRDFLDRPTEQECREASVAVTVEDPWPHFQVDIDVADADWRPLQALSRPTLYAWLVIDAR